MVVEQSRQMIKGTNFIMPVYPPPKSTGLQIVAS